MKAVIQRVKTASVFIKNRQIAKINAGLLVFLAVAKNDGEKQLNYLAGKISRLRIMADKKGKMNCSLSELKAEALVVPQFTLYADCQKGNRPSFIQAASKKKGEKIYNLFLKKLKDLHLRVQSGKFGAQMEVKLINDGPVTIILER